MSHVYKARLLIQLTFTRRCCCKIAVFSCFFCCSDKMLLPALICAISFVALGNALLIPHPWQAALMARYVVHEAGKW